MATVEETIGIMEIIMEIMEDIPKIMVEMGYSQETDLVSYKTC